MCPIKADIWVLTGQSNMAGNGRTPDTTTNPKIWMINMDNRSPENWETTFDAQLPLLGHRNWILIVDKAFPL
ncbi:MAG: sialate O-acetylesterase [Ignavibacteriaceae bacterium]